MLTKSRTHARTARKGNASGIILMVAISLLGNECSTVYTVHLQTSIVQRNSAFCEPRSWNILSSVPRDNSGSLNAFERQLNIFIFSQRYYEHHRGAVVHNSCSIVSAISTPSTKCYDLLTYLIIIYLLSACIRPEISQSRPGCATALEPWTFSNHKYVK